jgi:uncharacterized delta-60 repeat protein
MRNTKTYRLISAPMLALLALLFFGATTITAAPGDLDRTFGNGGIAMANRGNNPIVQLYSASAMAIQPDGKIVVVGQAVGEPHGANWESAVVRFNPDGSLDTSLGGTGIVINPVRKPVFHPHRCSEALATVRGFGADSRTSKWAQDNKTRLRQACPLSARTL